MYSFPPTSVMSVGPADSCLRAFHQPEASLPLSDGARTEVSSRADLLAARFFEKRTGHPPGLGEKPVSAIRSWHPAAASPSFPQVTRTAFSDDSPPYVLTTEIGHLEALSQLKLLPAAQEGLYLGFAFEFNYHVLAQRPVKFAWICDINQRMHALYTFVANTIIRSPTREAFLYAFRDELKSKADDYFGCDQGLENRVIDYYVNREFSWLHTDERFFAIKKLYHMGQIQHLNLDLVEDSSFFAQLKQWAEHNQLAFDIVYVSNIPECLQRSQAHTALTKMKANLLKIMSPQTILIDAKQQSCETGDPVLRVTSKIQDAETFPLFKTPRQKKLKPMSESHSGMSSYFF